MTADWGTLSSRLNNAARNAGASTGGTTNVVLHLEEIQAFIRLLEEEGLTPTSVPIEMPVRGLNPTRLPPDQTPRGLVRVNRTFPSTADGRSCHTTP